MTVTKAVVRGILVASLAATTARGGSILYLGVTPGEWPSTPIATNPTTIVATPVAASIIPIAPPSAPSLQLGIYGGLEPAPPAPSLPTPSAPPPASPPIVPMPSSTPIEAPMSPPGRYDAFINLGSGPFPDSGRLTTGAPQPWYQGAAVDRLFGGLPTLAQAAAFDATVLQRVQQTFALGGVPVSLTLDPNARAAHAISVVSQTSNPTLGSALGMTYLGGDGFQYVDIASKSASSIDQLAWIVAHNLAHELMLAFGVPEVHDQSGRYIDSPDASWSMMTSHDATFSPAAINDLLSRNFQGQGGAALGPSAQLLGPPTVPEPSTALLWATLATAGLVMGEARHRNHR